jgi:nicotinamidase-related amidase
MWPTHTVAGTDGSLFMPEIMRVLPIDLRNRIMAHEPSPVMTQDYFHSRFHIINQGMTRHADNHGMLFDAGGQRIPGAFDAFIKMATQYKADGIKELNITLCGAAENFNVRFCAEDAKKHLVPLFKRYGIAANIVILKDAIATVPDQYTKRQFHADHTEDAFKRIGATIKTIQEYLGYTPDFAMKTIAPLPSAYEEFPTAPILGLKGRFVSLLHKTGLK